MYKTLVSFVFFRLNTAIKATYDLLEDNNGNIRERPPLNLLIFHLLGRHFFTILSWCMMLRWLATSTALRYPNSPLSGQYFALDHLNGYLNSDGSFDANLMLADTGVFLTMAYFHDIIHRRPNRFFWSLAHDLLTSCTLTGQLIDGKLLLLPDLIRQMRQRWKMSAKNPAQLAALLLLLGENSGVPVIGHFPELQLEARVKLSCLLLATNLGHGLLFLFVMTAGIVFILNYLTVIYLNEGASAYFFFEVLCFPLLLYVFYFGFECALFFVYFYLLLAFIYRKLSNQMLIRLSGRLQMKASNCVASKQRSWPTKSHLLWEQIYLVEQWSRFTAHHNALAHIVMTISREVTSPGLAITFVGTIGMNVCGLTMLLLRWRTMSPFNVLVFVVMLACQTAAYLFCFACCIHITDSLHRAELVEGLGRLQMRLTGRRYCAVKFKLAVLYERVQCSEQLKFGFKVGPLSSISWRTVFEFSFVYTGFIMFFASILLSDRG